ncbi:MAG: Modification methylase RsrI [candidate division WS2 bacterium]|uniref:Modification methylase RsrI n=1 Tax=Psychracetigena formicireducens TaxID=2986056 RepID=A0A9E2BIZ1_PSYF1|nr:Modification methylase RsrI [Candidatus Psychracetigena formicireducens]MBT9145581.1 Modification methylase RsrI [Candidatus Psychracetigena formicireducens]
MKELTENYIDKIISYLEKGKPLPEYYKEALISNLNKLKHSLLFDTKKEYELIYADKEREEDILADTMAVPLQRVKTFRNGKGTVPDLLAEGGRIGTVPEQSTNMLIFGDNLQVLKTLLQMKQEGKLKNPDGTPGVRLVYIDPPFATRQEFRGSQDQKAYQDKIAGAKFLEFLRKRLVFLRELLSEDGSIYVHLDEKKSHYVKTLMDEIYGEHNFRNEIIWCYSTMQTVKTRFANKHETIFVYQKTDNIFFNITYENYPEDYARRFKYEDKKGKFMIRSKTGQGDLTLEDEKRNPEGTYRQYMKEGSLPKDWWVVDMLNSNSKERIEANNYPTQKPEALLERIIKASSNPGDLVMDCFAGSGTTLAVAEKLNRRWIGVDCGKLAIYTMQKRLLNIADSKDLENPKLVPSGSKTGKKYGKQCKPFTIYNAGLYDYKMIKELPWEQYRDFALKLFQCRDERHDISRIELDGYLGADSVMVFNYQKYPDAMMDRGFIDDLHKYLGDKIGRRFFVIAPAASVQFLEDYIEKGKAKYFILRIPYSIIEEIHNRGFTKIKQPVSEMDVNDTVDAVGFDFIQVPTVECQYYLDKPKKPDLLNQKIKECVIKIEKFESKIISRKPFEFANLETLSMVMLDYDFDGEVFNLDEVFYAEDLKKNGYEVRFDEDKAKEQMMIIYIDIFGNEKREVKALRDFKK